MCFVWVLGPQEYFPKIISVRKKNTCKFCHFIPPPHIIMSIFKMIVPSVMIGWNRLAQGHRILNIYTDIQNSYSVYRRLAWEYTNDQLQNTLPILYRSAYFQCFRVIFIRSHDIVTFQYSSKAIQNFHIKFTGIGNIYVMHKVNREIIDSHLKYC